VPSDILDAWRLAGLSSAKKRNEWEKRLAGAEAGVRAEFERRMRGELPGGFDAVIADYKKKLAVDRPKVATRKSSEMALEVINGVVPETIGGLRLASLMGIRSIFVMTHDSIGLGEDGPTHQPVEHLAALRAIPNHTVFRPADATEVAECWQLALESAGTPSTLALTRQNLPAVRTDFVEENLCAYGAYELATADGDAAVTIFASGSEVEIALAARTTLQAHGHPTRVVSVPAFELFEKQSADYQAAIIGNAPVKIAIEAAIRLGWDRFIGLDGIFIGMTGFGASGPIEALYPHFGITAEAAVKAAEARLHKKSN
jgi:transketolase